MTTKHCLLFASILVLLGCSEEKKEKQSTSDNNKEHKLTLPVAPAVVSGKGTEANYIALRYWEKMEWEDRSWLSDTAAVEQTFADFLYLLQHIAPTTADEAIGNMMKGAEKDSVMFVGFFDMCNKYLYDPNSPWRNETLYIAVLNTFVSSNMVSETGKTRVRFQLEMAMKNRIGEPAADFSYTLTNGKVGSLYKVKSAYTLLFFNNPDCHDCARVKGVLEKINAPGLKIVAIYPDEDLSLWKSSAYPSGWINGHAENVEINRLYDLKAIPTLYLLDNEKRVLMKDAEAEEIAQRLMQQP